MRDDVLEPAPVRIGSNEALSIDLTQEFACSDVINRIVDKRVGRDGKAW
jgi:hypothetical protein